GSAEPLKLTVEDIEVVETEQRTQNAVALLVDTSYSMAAEGRWVPMKQTALALHHLISTRFRGDELALITFGRYAMSTDIEELTALPQCKNRGRICTTPCYWRKGSLRGIQPCNQRCSSSLMANPPRTYSQMGAHGLTGQRISTPCIPRSLS